MELEFEFDCLILDLCLLLVGLLGKDMEVKFCGLGYFLFGGLSKLSIQATGSGRIICIS